MLQLHERRELISIARESIRAALHREAAAVRRDLPAALTAPGAAFVSLHIETRLRGCIGSLEAVSPLHRAVASAAVSAALRDPRFHPVTIEELSLIEIELSVISPMKRIASTDEVVVGRDGLLIRQGRRGGLLLPQVAVQYGWDRDEFLDHTCIKAGLPPGSWRDARCEISSFTAEVFSEAQL